MTEVTGSNPVHSTMIIAIDFDETYTEDPELWNSFIEDALARDHEIICVTARYNNDPKRQSINNEDIFTSIAKLIGEENIYFSGIAAKRNYMINKHNIYPHIWIDDTPLGIVE